MIIPPINVDLQATALIGISEELMQGSDLPYQLEIHCKEDFIYLVDIVDTVSNEVFGYEVPFAGIG